MGYIVDLHVILDDITKTAVCNVTDNDALDINGHCTLACSTLLLNDPLMDSDDMSHLPYNFCYIVRSL